MDLTRETQRPIVFRATQTAQLHRPRKNLSTQDDPLRTLFTAISRLIAGIVDAAVASPTRDLPVF